ncbi:unnamed protein product [Aspergillus oryzae RIB40]|uniref:DNA, SC010 n=1 Tax=Aspergillus oryzae (strain ATCC 42149 / RIB 40) TaxID=510516 RepID=Q2TX44_ASPOR|nr:unnamed protein product [Aspergillus oryzae RIB40]BAE66179.1 unnamed protein product [Aspergillus oryzae RIB40]
MRVRPGQYINLWLPSVSLRSWMQTHPFTVTSWSRDHQDTMELLVQPRHGLTADLLRYAPTVAEGSVSFLAFFTGPHGISEHVDRYESVLVIASGFGIATVRRLHLVWQVELISEIIAAQDLLNNLLKDDIMDDGYILNISIYVSSGLERNKVPFGQHKRVFLYQGVPDYRNVISLEASGEQIERLPNIRDEQGRTLVMGW